MTSKVRQVREKIEIKTLPDAWERFERFVTDIAKAGPKHRQAAKSSKPRNRTVAQKQRQRRSSKSR